MGSHPPHPTEGNYRLMNVTGIFLPMQHLKQVALQETVWEGQVSLPALERCWSFGLVHWCLLRLPVWFLHTSMSLNWRSCRLPYFPTKIECGQNPPITISYSINVFIYILFSSYLLINVPEYTDLYFWKGYHRLGGGIIWVLSIINIIYLELPGQNVTFALK